MFALKFRLPSYAACAGELAAAGALAWGCYVFNVQLVVLASGGLIWMLDHEAGPIAWAFSKRVPVFLGRISYSIYLIHLPLNALMQRVWPVYGHPPVTAFFILREIIFFTVLFGVCNATFHFIERPAQKLWRLKRNPEFASQEAVA